MHFRKASECVRLYGSAASVIDCEFTGSPRRPRGNITSNHPRGNWDGLLSSIWTGSLYFVPTIGPLLSRSLIYISSFIFHFVSFSFAISPSILYLFFFSFSLSGMKKPSKFWLVGYTRKSEGGPLLTCWLEVPVPGYLQEYVTSFYNNKLNSHLNLLSNFLCTADIYRYT